MEEIEADWEEEEDDGEEKEHQGFSFAGTYRKAKRRL